MKSKLLGLAAVVLLVGAGCAGQSYNQPAGTDTANQDSGAAAEETGPIKIGMSAPLTGEAASFGEAMQAGIEFALQEINAAGGINGRQVEVVYADDRCSKDGFAAFNKLVNVDKVVAIVGPVCSAAAGPGIPVAQEAGVPTLLTGASAPHLTAVGDYIFRYYPSDNFQGDYAADFLFNVLDKKKVAVVYVQNDWGKGLSDVFSKKFAQIGGEVVFNEAVNQDSKDIRGTITKFKATEPDAIYFPAYPAVGIVGLKQMRELDVDQVIVGGDAFGADEVSQSGVADGLIYTQAKVAESEEFTAKAKTATGKEATWVTPLTYDATKILAEVIGKVGTEGAAIRDGLKDIEYQGIAFPKASFDDMGELEEVAFDVKMIKGTEVMDYSAQ